MPWVRRVRLYKQPRNQNWFSEVPAAEIPAISKCSEGVKKLLVSLRNVLF